MGLRPAVFLDRDGVVIEDVHYLADPSQVRLLPGAASRCPGCCFARQRSAASI